MEKQDLSWLVKSGGRILGPFTKQEVTQLLFSREIVVLDEVAESHQRWVYIRDHIAFAKIVEELRQAQLKEPSEDTFTESMGDATISVTENMDQALNDEMTDDLAGFIQPEEVVIEGLQDNKEEKDRRESTRKESQPSKPPSYAMAGDKKVKKEIDEKSYWLRLTLAGLAAAVVFYLVTNNFLIQPMIQKTESEDLILQAKKKIYVGDVWEGYELLKKISGEQEVSDELAFYLGLLEIQEGGQTVRGRQLLRSLLNQEKWSYMASTAIGLSELKDGELDRAEDSMHRALGVRADYYSATLNLGVIALYRQDFVRAVEYFSAVARSFPEVAISHMLLATTYLEWGKVDSSRELWKKGLESLNDLLASNSEFQQEAELLKGYFFVLLGNRENAGQQVDRILSVDPFLIDEFRYNLLLHRDVVGWMRIQDWCEGFVQGVMQNARVVALRALCLVKTGRRIDARRAIDAAVNQGPRDPIVQSIFTYVLWQMGMMDQAAVALANAMEQNWSNHESLPLILQARFCYESGDVDCSVRYWQQVLQAEPRSVMALGHLSRIHFEKREFSTSQTFLVRGFGLSNNYKPLYQVRQWSQDQGLLPVQ